MWFYFLVFVTWAYIHVGLRCFCIAVSLFRDEIASIFALTDNLMAGVIVNFTMRG